jgi:hypothetical protein
MTTFAISRKTRVTGVGTDDYTVSGFGSDLKAFLQWYTSIGNQGDDSLLLNALFGMGGYAVGNAAQRAMWTVSRDNVAATSTRKTSSNTLCLRDRTAADASLATAEFNAIITDGVRTNYLTAGVPTRDIATLLIGGVGVQSYCGSLTGIGGSESITPGFDTTDTFIIFFTAGTTSINPATSETGAFAGVGVAAYDGVTLTQGCIGYREDNAVTEGAPQAVVSQTRIFLDPADTASNHAEIDVVTPTSYHVLNPVGISTLHYIVVKLNGETERPVVSFHTLPTAIGNAAIDTGIDIEPVFQFALWSQLTDFDVAMNDATAGAWGIGAWVGKLETEVATSTGFMVEDLAGTTNTASIIDARPLNVPQDDQSAGLKADFVRFEQQQTLLNHTGVMSGGRKAVVLTVGNSPGLRVYGGRILGGELAMD